MLDYCEMLTPGTVQLHFLLSMTFKLGSLLGAARKEMWQRRNDIATG